LSAIIPTERTRVRRRPQRASYDRALVNAILDEAMVCHVGFAVDGQPFVLPMAYARLDECLYLHGAVSNRMLKTLNEGAPACVTVTLLDGLVLARSAFHQSLNYRSVVILGTAREVTDAEEKRAALDALTEHLAPGRLAEIRAPSDEELRATTVLAIPVDEVSAKLRAGPPVDDDADLALTCWAGVVPLRLEPQAPVTDDHVPPGVEAPPAARFRRGD
jgi:nitroimidazol reductase NimA-like FMN-containing flavoprotein (pyridoxamine 5'-phosphate oxidase superfamily)